MKTVPTSFHPCRNNSCRRPGFVKTVPKKGGWPSRASCNPARIAKRTATAGWMISRKVIGPSERPMRFSHPRLSASSTIHLPGWAPLNLDYGSVLGAMSRVRPAPAERPVSPPRSPEEAVSGAMSSQGSVSASWRKIRPLVGDHGGVRAEASELPPALVWTWFSPLIDPGSRDSSRPALPASGPRATKSPRIRGCSATSLIHRTGSSE
jgi:hypothetical protein